MTVTKHEPSSVLAIRDDQAEFTDKQIAALRQMGVSNASPGDLAVFFHQAQRTGLDPFKREIYMIARQGKQTIQTGIDGFYKIADRVSRRTGGNWGITETYWCGPDGQWVDVWLQPSPPAAAKVIVERNGSRFTTVAITAEYKAAGPMWTKMPARMIAKCAEALAIRKAFPEDLSGLYTADEMAQADRGATHTVTQTAAAEAPGERLGAKGLKAKLADPEPEPVVTQADVDETNDVSDLRILWQSADPGLRLVIEQKVAELQELPTHIDEATGEVVDAEIVTENSEDAA